MSAPKPPSKPPHLSDLRLFQLAVADHAVFSGSEFSHLKECPICLEQWKQYLHDYVRENKKDARLKRGE